MASDRALFDEEAKRRFLLKIKKLPNGCWEWQGCVSSNGYGQFRYKKLYRSNRVAWLLFKGDIPHHDSAHGMCVLHKCDNRKCVNPDHLFLGTNHDNLLDALNKGRLHGTPRPRGPISEQERENKCKIKKYGRIAVRTLYAKGVSRKSLSDLFNVKRQVISRIVSGGLI